MGGGLSGRGGEVAGGEGDVFVLGINPKNWIDSVA
jgi:hypothetical protein